MDSLLNTLVAFVAEVDPARLPESVTQAVTHHVLDTVGCGAGGFDSPAAKVTREVSHGVSGPMVASMYGSSEKILIDAVALANGTANRYLDFNDFGTSGHPSDMIPAIFAVAEANGATGSEFVAGVYIAYEIASALAEAVPEGMAWDQGLYCALGVAAAASKIAGLNVVQTANALSLAIVPNVSMRVTRFGELSAWKAAAAPYACSSALTAVRLAAAGMTGPPEPFVGKNGIFENVWPAFELQLHCDFSKPTGIERSSLKSYGACYWAQVGVYLSSQLRQRVDIHQVQTIEVETCHSAWYVIGGGSGDAAQRWRPKTRETADHSLPFLMASMFVDGDITERSFSDERLNDEGFLSFVAKISVTERGDLSAQATRDTCPTEVSVHLVDGAVLKVRQEFPKGHPANPMCEDEIVEKFRKFTEAVLLPPEVEELKSLLLGIGEAVSLEPIAILLRKFRTRDEVKAVNYCQTIDSVRSM